MKKIWRLWLLLPLLLCLASCAKQQETAGLLWIKNFSGTEGVYDYGLTAMDEAFVLQTVAGPASIHPRTSESTTACPLPDGSYRLLRRRQALCPGRAGDSPYHGAGCG